MNILKIGIGVILVESVTAQDALGEHSTAMGFSTEAIGGASTAMGGFSKAEGVYSTAMGSGTTARGGYSTAMGSSTTASDYASVTIGQYNLAGSQVTNSATSFSTSNTAFVIGNGPGPNSRSDAFKVMFNGDAYVSKDLTVSGALRVAGPTFVNGGASVSNYLMVAGDLTVAGEAELMDGLTVYGDAILNGQLTIGGNVLTGANVTQLLNLLTQLAGTDADQKACLKTKWNALSTC